MVAEISRAARTALDAPVKPPMVSLDAPVVPKRFVTCFVRHTNPTLMWSRRSGSHRKNLKTKYTLGPGAGVVRQLLADCRERTDNVLNIYSRARRAHSENEETPRNATEYLRDSVTSARQERDFVVVVAYKRVSHETAGHEGEEKKMMRIFSNPKHVRVSAVRRQKRKG